MNTLAKKDIFTKEECEKIIQTLEPSCKVRGLIRNDEESIVRSSSIRGVPYHENKWIYDKIFQLFIETNEKEYKFDIKGIEVVQFSVYDVSDYYDWHLDLKEYKEDKTCRKISLSVQLSDPDTYEGGDLVFGTLDGEHIKSLREQGSVTIFPSFIRHKVTPVTKGTRYSLVAWSFGPNFV